MTPTYVRWTPTGYQCWRIVNGRYRLDVGPGTWRTPREAIAYSNALEAADITSLRASAERSDPRSLTPSGVGQVDRSAESLRSDSGPVGRVRG